MQVYSYFITQNSSTVLVKNNNFNLHGASQIFSKKTAVNISFNKIHFKTFKYTFTNNPTVLAIYTET